MEIAISDKLKCWMCGTPVFEMIDEDAGGNRFTDCDWDCSCHDEFNCHPYHVNSETKRCQCQPEVLCKVP